MPLNDTTPAPLQLNCSAPFPAPARLTFVDNCDNDVQVDSVDEDLGGSFCDGRLFKRKWEGPTDICGNRASEVTQTITFLDLEPPVLQSPLNEQQYTCPRDFALAQLPVPTVKDDCDESVTITSEATENKNCHNITVAWTATDVCNKKSQVNQTVRCDWLFCWRCVLQLRHSQCPRLGRPFCFLRRVADRYFSATEKLLSSRAFHHKIFPFVARIFNPIRRS